MTDDARQKRRRAKAEIAIRTLGEKGNPKAAAAHLGITEDTLRRRVAEYCNEYGYQTPVHAAYWLDRPKTATEIRNDAPLTHNG